ncbi:MAG: nucleotidyl transferase AbiEii/AbiGii toxin family protein [Isosphaeraceae bacterium]
MSTVEEVYHQAWGKLGGAARLRRTSSLFSEMWRMLELQIAKQHPSLGDHEIRRLTAKRMYLSDASAQLLLERPWRQDSVEHDLQETLKRVLDILSQLGARFHLTGGLASSYYGDPRFTQDIDLVIELSEDRPEAKALLARLSSGYFVNEQVAMEAIRQNGLFQAIDEASLIKIDFHVGEKIPGELARSACCEIFPGLVAPIVSQEDAILSKLLWIKLGSHKASHDVKMMLKRSEDLDAALLRERAASLGLDGLLGAIEAEYGSD